MLLFGILLFVVGCSSSDISEPVHQNENVSTINTVIEHQFTGPDQELIELYNSPENGTEIGDGKEKSDEELEKPTELDLYLKEKYQSHFTENMYSKYIVTYALDYQLAASMNDYKMEVNSINIEHNEKNEDIYDFTANVLYKKEENEQVIAKVSGRANIYEEGKIAKIQFLDDDGLLEALMEAES